MLNAIIKHALETKHFYKFMLFSVAESVTLFDYVTVIKDYGKISMKKKKSKWKKLDNRCANACYKDVLFTGFLISFEIFKVKTTKKS